MDCDETGTAYDQEIAVGDDSAGRACREEQMGEPGEIDFETEKENVEGHENGRHSNQKDKERSKELDKPRSKDRRKSRREEKEHAAKDRDKSKPRDVEKGRDKDSEKNETKEKDRTTGKERRKDENGTSKRKDTDLDYRGSVKHKEMSKDQETDYGRDRKENEYNKDREHEKDREKERDKERQREKDRDRDRHRDKDRGRDTNREREHERGIERIQEHGKDRESKMDREIEREYDGGKERVKEHDRRKEQDKDRGRDRGREKEHDWKERERDMEKERERERENDRDHEREKDRERERERDKAKDRERGKEKPKDREKERVKERDKERDRFENDKGKDKTREKDKEKDTDKISGKDRDKERTKDKLEGKSKDRDYKEMNRVKDGEKDKRLKPEGGDIMMQVLNIHDNKKDHIQKTIQTSSGSHTSTSDLHARITKMKEDRLEKKTDGGSEILSWVSKSRKLEEKVNVEKEKALFLAKAFEEQDNVDQEESEDEDAQHTGEDLAGVKILHGLDKVIEGGAVVLTLKDQNILADGDINNEIDMLENVEIGEQKQRDEAYKAAKKSNKYDDKFGDDVDTQKTILPQYDDSKDEGITLDETGRFTGEAEKKLQELRKRLEGTSTGSRFEDLTSTSKVSSDYYTQDEMLQFKKPKKKKSLRKKDKLDLAALEAEAISAGLGADDLGSRKGGHRESAREEQEKSDTKMRDSAYHLAYVKADEASKALRQEQTLVVQTNDDEIPVFGEDAEDLYKSMERARKLAFRKKDETMVSHTEEIASIASADGQSGDTQNPGEPQENKVVFTEMMEFVWGLQLDEDAHKHEDEDVPKDEDEDEVPKSVEEEMKDVAGGWTEVKEAHEDELPINEEKEEVAPDETIHEAAVGKGLSGALQLLKERGTLKESIDWGGRNMDKKKSKLVGIRDNDGPKEIILDRLDEFGRIMTPKEAFRKLSHKFHGKGPGKMKQEKRMKQYEEELRLKQMNPSDTPLLSMEKMREAQAKLRSPFIMLNGQMKPGQTSDPRSGFATVEKDLPGSLTPMLGDRKVEHFLGIKRKAEPSNLGPPKKPKT